MDLANAVTIKLPKVDAAVVRALLKLAYLGTVKLAAKVSVDGLAKLRNRFAKLCQGLAKLQNVYKSLEWPTLRQ